MTSTLTKRNSHHNAPSASMAPKLDEILDKDGAIDTLPDDNDND